VRKKINRVTQVTERKLRLIANPAKMLYKFKYSAIFIIKKIIATPKMYIYRHKWMRISTQHRDRK
jgi:hypothetical protein